MDVYFEQEKLWLHDQQVQMLITLYCALAQNESENMSRNIRWGIRQGFKNGTSRFADFTCYGYRQDEKGNLIVHDTEAKVVQEIFEMRAAGFSLGKISEWLFENGILSPTGKERWSRETLSKMLRNDKYESLSGFKTMTIATEIFDLYTRTLIHSSEALLDAAAINPSNLRTKYSKILKRDGLF